MISKNKILKQILILVGLSYLFFMLGNGIVSLTNPDEVFYAQIAKEMAQHKTWMVPYLFSHPNFEKPIFTYWLLRIGFIIFGISSFSARFFPAFFATLGIIAVYLLAFLGYKDEKKAFICALILVSSGLYIGLARTVFTDMIFSIWILFSLLAFFWGYSRTANKTMGILLFFIFSSLAVLTKGPLGLLIPFLIILAFLLIKKDMKFLLSKGFVWGFFIFVLISLPWYIFMLKKYGSGFMHEFFYNDHIRRIIEAEHTGNDKWYFYPFSIIGCMFPWSLYAIFSLVYLLKNFRHRTQPIYNFLICWIGVTFLIFQFAHSKLVSYIFPLFPAIALITGDFVYDKLRVNNSSRLYFFIALGNLFALLLIPLGLIISLIKYPDYISSYLSSKIPAYYLITACLALVILMLFFILRNKLLKNIYTLVLIALIFLYAALLVHNNIEPYVSSKKACEYLLGHYNVTNAILCAKPFVRGIRYYSDKDVAVIDISGKNFFSPHPIPFLDSERKVKDFLHSQSVTYCVLKKSSFEDIKRIMGNEFKFTILKIIGNEYILKIEQL